MALHTNNLAPLKEPRATSVGAILAGESRAAQGTMAPVPSCTACQTMERFDKLLSLTYYVQGACYF